MKRLIFILSLLFITTTLSADIWRECKSPECHYEEKNIIRKASAEAFGEKFEPITHNCEKCEYHKCLNYYYLTDENGDVVFIKKDNFTNKIIVHFKATDTFLFDTIVDETTNGPFIDSEGEFQLYGFWCLKCDERQIYIDYINEIFDIFYWEVK